MLPAASLGTSSRNMKRPNEHDDPQSEKSFCVAKLSTRGSPLRFRGFSIIGGELGNLNLDLELQSARLKILTKRLHFIGLLSVRRQEETIFTFHFLTLVRIIYSSQLHQPPRPCTSLPCFETAPPPVVPRHLSPHTASNASLRFENASSPRPKLGPKLGRPGLLGRLGHGGVQLTSLIREVRLALPVRRRCSMGQKWCGWLCLVGLDGLLVDCFPRLLPFRA